MSIQLVDTLLNEFRQTEKGTDPQLLKFEGVGNNDVYNITAAFLQGDTPIIAGRVEARDSEHSKVMFFEEKAGAWTVKADAPVFELQDPFFTKINGELVLGGVEIYYLQAGSDALGWRTVFYKGADIYTLEKIFVGPKGMKDLRLVQLANKEIGVITRPQGEKGGRGQIGFAVVSDLSQLSTQVIEEAPLLAQFTAEEWGGANEAHILSNGLVGILGHIAKFDDQGDRHYYPMVFALDAKDGANLYSKMTIIGERANFVDTQSKRPDLYDVVFSGGLVRNGDGTATLYAGISDAVAQTLTIKDPFIKFEQGGLDA